MQGTRNRCGMYFVLSEQAKATKEVLRFSVPLYSIHTARRSRKRVVALEGALLVTAIVGITEDDAGRNRVADYSIPLPDTGFRPGGENFPHGVRDVWHCEPALKPGSPGTCRMHGTARLL